MPSNEPEPLYYYPPKKTDHEQFDFMIEKSHDARECKEAWINEKFFKHSVHIIDLVKIGYTRDELYSFLRVLYSFHDSCED